MKDKEISVHYLPTEEMIAALFSKPSFNAFQDIILIYKNYK
jgi:hypothetical protein